MFSYCSTTSCPPLTLYPTTSNNASLGSISLPYNPLAPPPLPPFPRKNIRDYAHYVLPYCTTPSVPPRVPGHLAPASGDSAASHRHGSWVSWGWTCPVGNGWMTGWAASRSVYIYVLMSVRLSLSSFPFSLQLSGVDFSRVDRRGFDIYRNCIWRRIFEHFETPDLAFSLSFLLTYS